MKQKLSKNKYLYKKLKFEEIQNPQYFFNLWTKSNLVKLLVRFFFNKEKFIKLFDFRIVSSLILYDLNDSKSSILNFFLLLTLLIFLYRLSNKIIIEKKYLNLIKIVHGETNYYGYREKTLQKILKKTLYIFPHYSFSNSQDLKKKKEIYLSIRVNLKKKLSVIPGYDPQISEKLEWWKLWIVKEIFPSWNLSANVISKMNVLLEKKNAKELKYFFKFYIDNIICQNYDWENKFNSIFYKNYEKRINLRSSGHKKILEDTLILQIFSAFCEKLILEVEDPQNLNQITKCNNNRLYFSSSIFYEKKVTSKLLNSLKKNIFQKFNFWNELNQIITKFSILYKIEKSNKLKSLSNKVINNYKTIGQILEYKNNFFRYLKKSDKNRFILLWKIKKDYQNLNSFIPLDYAYNNIRKKKYNIAKSNLLILPNGNFFSNIFNLFEFLFFKYNKIINFYNEINYNKKLILQFKKLINLIKILDQLNLIISKPSLINNNNNIIICSINYQNYNNYKLKKKLLFNQKFTEKNEKLIQNYQKKLKINNFFKKFYIKFIVWYKLKYSNFYKILNKFLNSLSLTKKFFYQIEKTCIKNIINKKLLNSKKKKKNYFYYNKNNIYINSKLNQFKISNQEKKLLKFVVFQQQNLTLLFNKIEFINNNNKKKNSIIIWSNKLIKKDIYIFHKNFKLKFYETITNVFQKTLKILFYYPKFIIIQNNFLKKYILNKNNWSQQTKFNNNNKLIIQIYFDKISITKFIINYFYNNKNTNNIYIKYFTNTFFFPIWQSQESYFNSIKISNKNLRNFQFFKKDTLNLLNFLHYSDFNYKKNNFFLKKKNKNNTLVYKKLIKNLPLKKKKFLFIDQLNYFCKKKHKFLNIESEIFKIFLSKYLKIFNHQKLIFIYTYDLNKLLNSLIEIHFFFYEKKNIDLFIKKIYIRNLLKPKNNFTQIKFKKKLLLSELFLTIKNENNEVLNWINNFFINSNSTKNLIESISSKILDINNINNSTKKINYKENKNVILFFSKDFIKLVQKLKIQKIIETSSFFIKWIFFKKYMLWFFTFEWWKYFQNIFLNLFSEILLNIHDHFNYILPTFLESIQKKLSDLLINSPIIIKNKNIHNFFEKWNLRLLKQIYDNNKNKKNKWSCLNLINKRNTQYIVIISLIIFSYLISQHYFSILLGSNFFELWAYYEIIRYLMDFSRGFYLDNLMHYNSIQFIKSENLLMHFIKNFEHYIKNVKFYLFTKQKIHKLLNNNKGLDLSRRERKLLVQSLITEKSLSQYKLNLISNKLFQFDYKIIKQQKRNYLENLTEIYQKNLVNYPFYQCHLVENLVFLAFWQKAISSQILWQIDTSNLIFSKTKRPIPLELRLSSLKGILLIGSLESGRSYLVKNLAANSFVPLIKISINKLLYNKPDIITESWINILMESLRRLSLILELAEKLSPCLIWVQNIHEFNVNRSTQNIESDPTFLLGIFLKYFQTGFIKKNTKNIVIIGSSHLPKKVDPALISPNRLDRLINIRMFNILQRQKKISILLYSKHSKDFYSKNKKACFNEFAYRTMGYNLRDLTGLINEILLISITQNQKNIHTNTIRLAFHKHTLGSTYINTKIKFTQNYGILFYKVGKVIIQNIFIKNFSKNPLYIGNDLWKKKFYYLSKWYLEPSIFESTLKEFTILPYILGCLAGLAARDSWFILENKPDNLISLEKSIENDFYLACGILENLLIDFPWLEIFEKNNKKKNVTFQFQIKNPFYMIKKGLFLTVDKNTTNKISNKFFKQITFYKRKLYQLTSNITWTPKSFRLSFIRNNLFNWIKRPNEFEIIYNLGFSKKKERKIFNGAYGISHFSEMIENETKEQLPYERILSRIRRRNVQELESQLEDILFEEQFTILGFSQLSTEYHMECQLSNKPMIFIGGRFIWDPTGLLSQIRHFIFSRQFLFIDEEMLRRLYVTYGARREREKSRSSQKIKQFFLRRGYGRDSVNDLSINWWNQLPLIEKNNIEIFKRIEGVGVQLKRPQVFTPVYLYQSWLIENSKENLTRFELLDNQQRWLKRNSLLFNDSFIYNTLLEIYKYLLKFFISHQILLNEMTKLLLKNKWLFQNEIEYFINIINITK